MRVQRLVFSGAIALTIIPGVASSAAAQGCILLRQTSPMFGTTGPQQEVGAWTLVFTGRHSTADIHYNGTVRQRQRETEGTYVVNRQNSMTATLGYQFSPRLSFNVGVPYIEASWGIPSPRSGGPAARANENARGVGDITTLARVSLFNPMTTLRTWNLQFGGGVKFPTGNNKATDMFPDGNGNNNALRYVDISVHPGDGGWGFIMDVQGYKSMWRFTTFGSGTWLANPRDTGTASRGNLVTNSTPTNINTVSDQFVFRAGTTFAVTRQMTASIAWRMEGVPRYDIFGPSHGFRRPGVEMYWEPGVTVSTGRHAVSFNFPVGYYFNRFRNPYTGTAGDSTFPEYVSIATYSLRLGRVQPKHQIMTDSSAGEPHAVAADETFKPFTLPTVEGAQHSLAQVLNQATLVVFFYPTCKFCNAAFPEIQKLHDTYKDRGLSVVWINVVPEEERLIPDWRTKHGYTVPILVGGQSIQNDYKVAMTPTHYLLDAQGKVLSKHAGYKPGDEKALEEQIRQALGN